MWESPSKSARELMSKQCKKDCFLMQSELKFPVCDTSCQYSCSGIHAAYVRAREWKYESVAIQAAKMLQKQCGWHPHMLGGSLEQSKRTLRWANRSIHIS